MAEEKEKNMNNSEDTPQKKYFDRRDILKGLATVPVLGVFFWKLNKKVSLDDAKRENLLSEIGLDKKTAANTPETVAKPVANKKGDLIRLGIIGFGGRAEYLCRGAGFAHPDWVEQKKADAAKNKTDKVLEDFINQEDLNVVFTGVCDVFSKRADRAVAMSKNGIRSGGGAGTLAGAKSYRTYQELLASPDIDAVIIATPDHWHAQIVLDAVAAGKHVYVEKCMTRTFEEAKNVYNAVKASKIVFQLGHQNRQQESHIKAKEIIEKGILGNITLVETTTNRNDPNGAWVYEIEKEGSPQTIDWKQFLGSAPQVPFSPERFFRWRCWYDYGTGLSGDLLSHEYDSVNQILELGIPKTVTASGGIYFFKDGRDVPDVFQTVCEYPDRDLTFVYSATLANGKNRGSVFMGHDASMEVGGGVTVLPDGGSTRFKEKIEKGIIDLSMPLFTYTPGSGGFDAVTTATEQYFASKGLMYTYKNGKRVDSTHLHIKDWLDCIRNGGTTLCNIERGFEEATTCHMATTSFLQGRRVSWDPEKKQIV